MAAHRWRWGVAWALAATAAAWAGAEQTLWHLRDCYTYTTGDAKFYHALDNAQWRILDKDGGAILAEVGLDVTLEDGTTLTNSQFSAAGATRATVQTPLGDAVDYVVSVESPGKLATKAGFRCERTPLVVRPRDASRH